MAASHSWSSRPNAPALHPRPLIPNQHLQTIFYHANQRGQRAVIPVPHVVRGPPVPGDMLSTQMGAEVESKFSFIFQQLGLMVQENKTMLRKHGRWEFDQRYEVFFEMRRVIAAVLRERPEAPEDTIRRHAEHIGNGSAIGHQFRDDLLKVARDARRVGQDAARAVQTHRPPVPPGSMVLEIDIVVAPTAPVHEDAASLHFPVPVRTLTDQKITEEAWSTIASNCQNGAFVEVTSQSWEQHGKLHSPSLLWLHEARQQHFPQGNTMYFYDGHECMGAVNGLHCYWFHKNSLLQVKELLLQEQLRKVTSEIQALMAHSSAGTTSSSVVWVRELARKDKQLTDGEEFEPTGNAFQVKGAFANVDDLKEGIKNKAELSIPSFKIDIYSQQDRKWVMAKTMSASLRDTTEEDCYGFVLPQKTDDV
ncbi:unnamed protein product [Symbiodinium sp. CCMP2592]|nr:unnamed protein product [Symbiodinium sp. CCMP2592]